MTRDVRALLAFINSRQNTPHEWGRDANDCVSFVLGAAKAQTGHDRATSVKWHDEKSGLKAIAKFGSLEAAFDRWFVRIPPSQAMRGDIGGVPDETFGIHPMIVEGTMLVGPADKGNKRLRRREMTVAWSAVLPPPRKKAAK
jgi:hypothetical protein